MISFAKVRDNGMTSISHLTEEQAIGRFLFFVLNNNVNVFEESQQNRASFLKRLNEFSVQGTPSQRKPQGTHAEDRFN